MPRQNLVTRLEAVATGLGLLADELNEIYGEPTPNLLYWRLEILEVVEELTATASPSSDSQHSQRSEPA